MADYQFWILIIAIAAVAHNVGRAEKRLSDIYRLLKFGKEEDND